MISRNILVPFVVPFVLAFVPATLFAQTTPDPLAAYGNELFFRITGAPLSPHRSDIKDWQALIQKKNWNGFAAKALLEPNFIDVTTLSWASRYYSGGTLSQVPLDDAMALIVGSVRDNRDARQILTGDYVYQPDPRLGVRSSLSDNDAYGRVEEQQLSLSTAIHYESPQWSVNGYDDPAGVLTTRSWAAKAFNAGTNRRAVRLALETFLCRPNASWMVPNLPEDRIRQDIDRAPGGDARVFQTSCRLCHGTLDAFAGAFAHMDFVGGTFLVDPGIRPKYLQHSDMYPEGYVTTDDSWINNLARTGDALGTSFGWRGIDKNHGQGHGAQGFGQMLSESSSFSACLVKNVYSILCLQDKELTDPLIQQISNDFENQDSYRLKDLFLRVALRPECISPLQ